MADEVKEKADENPQEVVVTNAEKVYGDVMSTPVIEAVDGFKFDFNFGLRISCPADKKDYHVRFSDADTGLILYDGDLVPGNTISHIKKYYIRYHFVITNKTTGEKIFEHTLDLKDKTVIVQFPVSTLGDSIGWFSYVERFQKKHGCKLVLVISDFIREIVEKQYPQFEYISKNDTANYNSYAMYYIGLFFHGNLDYQPVDFREVGLHKISGYILGLRSKEELDDIPPRFDLTAERKIKEKYVVISCKASAHCKMWNNPFGWDGVIRFLKENGYRVLCIDKDRTVGKEGIWHQLPWGVEDYTGNIPLQERINVIKDADLFIGLSSGLSWLAWGCNVPVVIISGFTLPRTEFYTPYRVINYMSCNGCWDDVREDFNHSDFFWCPRHKDDAQKYECTTMIPPEQVINVIKTVPTFRPLDKNESSN